MARTTDQLARLNARFSAVSENVRQAVMPALDQGADQLVTAAKHLAPEDDGDLKDSIRKEDGEHPLQRVVKAGDDQAFYAMFVEHGTVAKRAQPFMFPAYRLHRKQIENRIKRAIGKAIKAEWNRP
ncbi:HK97-gp10 family putative phage morphogenesis protein [Aurantimonas coralicida]|uniref:HK97-gp10 family putative phage morphogenesis protein n=1 Tax=Aurantimonas coralicida TaxID=182270 RepID=UPI001D185262|nr:HK97-gp10 family putative phage morphogenesis protein [Aurantimonas coralicida]MCC4298133.1 HK97 gp10 family phage protein [Aurantimonas coralicida]